MKYPLRNRFFGVENVITNYIAVFLHINKMYMKKVSIKDIAQKAGVSNATVSLVLSGKSKNGRVGKETAEEIHRIARELNYQPNNLARSLQSGRSQTIGLLVADISNPFFGTLAFYIQEQFEKSGYAVIIMNTNESDVQMGKMIGILKNRQVDGYIIVPTEHGESYVKQLVDANMPLVLIDRYYPAIQTYSVMLDGYQASFKATRLLIEKGCKRIGLLVYDGTQSHMSDRKYGYIDALKQVGLYDSELICEVNFSNFQEDVSKAITNLIEKKVDGIFFVTISISLAGIRALFNQGIKVQEDIQVVCFDRSEVFDFLPHPLPYILQPIEAMAHKAVEFLLEQIETDDYVIQTSKFPPTLVNRR